MKALRRSVFEYLGIGITGATVLILLMPFVRVAIVSNTLDRAERLMRDGECRLALAYLSRIESWASLYPIHAHRLSCQAIRCQARLCDFRAAQTRADEVFRRRYMMGRPGANAWELFQGLPNALINGFLGGSGRAAMIPASSGYEALAAELTRMGEHGRLSALSASLLSRDPRDPLGLRLNEFVASRNVPLPAAAPQPYVPLTAVASVSGMAPPPAPSAVPSASAPASTPSSSPPAAGSSQDPRPAAAEAQWGVVAADDTRTYDFEGVFRGTLEAGTLLQISDIRSTQVGPFAACRPDRSGVAGALVLIPMSDLNAFPGSLSAAKDSVKSLRVQEARLEADIRKTKAQIAAALEQQSPAAVRYQEAKKAYLQFWEKARDLMAKRDTAAGAEKIRLEDQLRQMRSTDIQLRGAYESAKKEHDAWKSRQRPPDPSQNPTLVTMETRLQDLRRQIAAADKTP